MDFPVIPSGLATYTLWDTRSPYGGDGAVGRPEVLSGRPREVHGADGGEEGHLVPAASSRGSYDEGMLRAALRPRSLGMLALMVAATVVCGMLAGWQWDRAHRAITERTSAPAELGDVRDVLEIGGVVTNDDSGGIVTATGTYDASQQILVGGRHIDGTDAAIVVTALHLTLADGSEALLPVARGWVAAEDVTGADGELDPALAPAPPSGEVTATGRLEASEAATDGVEDGIASEISTPLLVNEWGSPMYAGYVAQTSAAEGLQPMPEAESAFSRGLDWQNIGYAAQWIVFGVFFLYLWWRTVRTHHLDEQEAQREALRAALGEETPRPAPGADAPTPAGAPGAAHPQEDADAGTPPAR